MQSKTINECKKSKQRVIQQCFKLIWLVFCFLVNENAIICSFSGIIVQCMYSYLCMLKLNISHLQGQMQSKQLRREMWTGWWSLWETPDEWNTARLNLKLATCPGSHILITNDKSVVNNNVESFICSLLTLE